MLSALFLLFLFFFFVFVFKVNCIIVYQKFRTIFVCLGVYQVKLGSCLSGFQGTKNSFTVFSSAVPPKVCVQETVVPKIETGGWKSVKSNKSASTHKASNKMPKQKGVSSIQKVVVSSLLLSLSSVGYIICLLFSH